MAERTPKELKALFETTAFDSDFYYEGKLGADYAPTGTWLRVWSPLADSVTVSLYHRGDGGFAYCTLPLEKQEKGVWAIYLPSDRHGVYYTYSIQSNGRLRKTADPYSHAVGVNGQRSMIVDLSRTNPKGWETDHRPSVPVERRSVWEVSVRDFSSCPDCGISPVLRGKYLAFTQSHSTLNGDGIHPTCLNYLRRLGVSHIQLMPVYDFGSIDEAHSSERQYNWGYDPVHFNVPEGSYSTDPTRGEVRIREFKQMVAALHSAGMGVVMDVVYNHMYSWDNCLNAAVPYYYFRQNPDGSFSDGSGCGNELATERKMVRRYIVDSVLYWAREYHIDGFRFDLMGLYDVETVNEIRAELDKLPHGEEILMYGEPWQGGGSQLRKYEANKNNLSMLSDRVGIFCDNTRDAIKGSCFDGRSAGYAEGNSDSYREIVQSVSAWCGSDILKPRSPSQIVSYVSAHDNFTLWDKLMLVRYNSPDYDLADPVLLAQNRLIAGIYLTCMGIPFMQAGEEFARTKQGEGNSYHSPVEVNWLDWGRALRFHGLVDYYRGLLALRSAFPRLGATDRESTQSIEFSTVKPPLVGWRLKARPTDNALWSEIAVFYNPTKEYAEVELPVGRWKLLCNGTASSLWRGKSSAYSGQALVEPVGIAVLGRVD